MKKNKSNKKRTIVTLGVIAVIFSIILLYFNRPNVEGEKFLVSQKNETTLSLGKVLGNESNSVNKAITEIKEEVQSKQGEEQKAADSRIAQTNIKATKTGKVIVIDPGHSLNPAQGTEPQSPGSSIMKAKDVSGAF